MPESQARFVRLDGSPGLATGVDKRRLPTGGGANSGGLRRSRASDCGWSLIEACRPVTGSFRALATVCRRPVVGGSSTSVWHSGVMAASDPDDRLDRRQVLADRVHRYNAPLAVLFSALTVDQAKWLRLQPREIEPRVLEAVPLERVVWSSFWPVSPQDTIEFDLSAIGSGGRLLSRGKFVDGEPSAIRFRWLTDSPPDERGIALTRQRLNRKFGGDLRAVVSEFYWLGLPNDT